jgi:hypothetical protein
MMNEERGFFRFKRRTRRMPYRVEDDDGEAVPETVRVKSSDVIDEHMKHFSRLFNNEQFSDCVFLVGEEKKKFFAHSLILIAHSSYFEKMLSSGMRESTTKEIIKPNITSSIFEQILRFMYSAEIDLPLSLDKMIDYVLAAEELMISSLSSVCEWHVEKFLNADNACAVLVDYSSHEGGTFARISDKCTAFININFIGVIASESFLKLPKELLLKLLKNRMNNKSKCVPAISEVALFDGLVNWGKYQVRNSYEQDQHENKKRKVDDSSCEEDEDLEKLRVVMSDILECINFRIMDAHDIKNIVEPTKLLPPSHLLDIYRDLATCLSSSSSSSSRKQSKVPALLTDELYNELWQCRKDIAANENITAGAVCDNSAIRYMANARPTSTVQLMDAGVWEQFTDKRHARIFLDVIKKFVKLHHLEPENQFEWMLITEY